MSSSVGCGSVKCCLQALQRARYHSRVVSRRKMRTVDEDPQFGHAELAKPVEPEDCAAYIVANLDPESLQKAGIAHLLQVRGETGQTNIFNSPVASLRDITAT